MDEETRQILAQCYYALGEAITTSAYLKDINDGGLYVEGLSQEIDEDIDFFQITRETIYKKLFGDR